LLQDFEEEVLIENDKLSLKDNANPTTKSTFSSKKKIEILPKPPSNKKDQERVDIESLPKRFSKDIQPSYRYEKSCRGRIF
jgi:hypothetical protein